MLITKKNFMFRENRVDALLQLLSIVLLTPHTQTQQYR